MKKGKNEELGQIYKTAEAELRENVDFLESDAFDLTIPLEKSNDSFSNSDKCKDKLQMEKEKQGDLDEDNEEKTDNDLAVSIKLNSTKIPLKKPSLCRNVKPSFKSSKNEDDGDKSKQAVINNNSKNVKTSGKINKDECSDNDLKILHNDKNVKDPKNKKSSTIEFPKIPVEQCEKLDNATVKKENSQNSNESLNKNDSSKEYSFKESSMETICERTVTLILNKDTNGFIDILLTESFEINYDCWIKIFDENPKLIMTLGEWDILYGSIVVPALLGIEALGAFLWNILYNEKIYSFTLRIITACLFKNILKSNPKESYLSLFKKEMVGSTTDTSKSNLYIEAIISTPRMKEQKYSNESIVDTIKKIHRAIETGDEEVLFEIMLTYCKTVLVTVSIHYFRKYQITIYDHARKSRINPIIYTYLHHSISTFTDLNMYLIGLFRMASKNKKFSFLFPYLLEIIANINRKALFAKYKSFYGETILETISILLPQNICKAYEKLMKMHNIPNF